MTEKVTNVTKKLNAMFAELKYEVDMSVYEIRDTEVEYLIKLLNPAQFARMFKVPNLIYDHIGIEASEIIEASGAYSDWLLTVKID